MTVDFLHFTQDESEDITNAPRYYHNFEGAAVRIQVHWTSGCLNEPSRLSNSLILIRRAAAVLKKYTLSLDVVPPGLPTSAHQSVHEAVVKGWAPSAPTPLDKLLPQMIGELGGEAADAIATNAWFKKLNFIQFDKSIYAPHEGGADIEKFQELRGLIDPVPEENRLMIVFVPVDGAGGGYTSTFSRWLPWIVLDPKRIWDDALLLHEIGHACRLAHQRGPTNFMSNWGGHHSHLWGWQADTIYNSYWCKGPRFEKWWRYKPLPKYHPFLWGN